MIKKRREKSVRLETCEAGCRRVPSNHPSYPQLEAETGRLQAGYRGEKALDYYLTFLPHDNYQIFHGLRLEDHKNRYFQMDTLLLTFSHCLILEAKNITGELEFDEKCHQLKRKTSDGYEALGDPISQVERHKYQLTHWLEHHFGKKIPVIGQVVLTNKHATLISATSSLMNKVTFHTNLPNKISKINENFPSSILNEKELRKIARTLVKKHTPDSFLLLDFFKIKKSEKKNGVICPECAHCPMKKKRMNWLCLECGLISQTAHYDALDDYKRLLGSAISTSQAMEYLQLNSRMTSLRILKSMDLHFDGNGKSRVYYLEGWHIA
ncbi:nuclease-related domain-containing protein [Sutcliffiella deserti]|uniref:nuclease-related domain-containing protein n=1 Tax=Sutcliffiella deserti TaxID=2875501 RepID=UPI001CBD5C11|nr:nuclease-related domain-containing protein [Sutcliffiella deserti]